MDYSHDTYFANILNLSRVLDILIYKQNDDIVRFVRNGFARWIFILNKMGKLVNFVITDYNVLKNLINEDIKFISRKIVVNVKKMQELRAGRNPNHPPLNVQMSRNASGQYIFRHNKYFVYLTKKQYDFLSTNYLGKMLNTDIFILGMFYNIIGGKNIGADVELFGSPFNVSGPYCSPLEFERRFSSLGSFYNHKFESKVYATNPPYDEEIMNDMADRILEAIKTVEDISFVIILPVWDPQTQKEYNIVPARGYKKFDAFDKLIPHVKYHKVFGRNDAKYYNYYTDKETGVVHSHVMVLSNSPTVDELIKKLSLEL
jgi:hypothetical protein